MTTPHASNPDFKEPEIIYTSSHKTSCNGGGGTLGHPLTYYYIGESGVAKCTYCDRQFIYKPNA